jgi:hypothetical protein
MAYHGQIQYLLIIIRDVKWEGNVEWDRSVWLVEINASDSTYVLEARVRRLRDCEIKPEGMKRVILDEDNEVGQLYFDT